MIKKYLNFDLALKQALEFAQVSKLNEIVTLENSLNRVLAQDIYCVKNLPSFNNSAMDGFAIKASHKGKELYVVKTIFAGDSAEKLLKENECYKIMTGAKVPDDVDTIIPIENVEFYKNDIVKIKQDVKKGACLRLKGEECKIGELLFNKNQQITSAMITLFASQGLNMIKVYKKISIAIVSTGDEIKEPWENANDNEIYNCNSYALISLLKEKGFNASYLGLIPDNLDKSVEFIHNITNYDVIITSGGISMGDADFIGEAFLKNNLEIIFHGVNIKPGRPIMMGTIKKENHNTFVICLPGNPLTAMVNMHLFSIPVLRKIQGYYNIYHDVIFAKNMETFTVKQGRVNVVLGSCNKGEYQVTQKNRYGSGMISALSYSNSILVSSEETSIIQKKDTIKVISFNCSYLDDKTNIFN